MAVSSQTFFVCFDVLVGALLSAKPLKLHPNKAGCDLVLIASLSLSLSHLCSFAFAMLLTLSRDSCWQVWWWSMTPSLLMATWTKLIPRLMVSQRKQLVGLWVTALQMSYQMAMGSLSLMVMCLNLLRKSLVSFQLFQPSSHHSLILHTCPSEQQMQIVYDCIF